MTDALLHHAIRGEGRPALVLVHGLCCSLSDWRHQVDHFSPRHRTLACDLRGHGASTGFDAGFDILTSGGDVAALLEREALGPAVLVGHSMGCRVVLEAARRAPPGAIAAVVLVDGSLLGPDPDDPSGEPASFIPMRERAFAQMFVERHDPALKAAVIERALAVPGAVADSFFRSMVAYDTTHAERAFSALEVPLVAIQSTYLNDARERVSMVPGMHVPLLDTIERVVPGARIEIVEGVGHFTMIEAPESVNRSIEQVLGEVSAT